MGYEDAIRRGKELTITSDVTLPEGTTYVYVGVAGSLKVDLTGGGTITLLNVAAGVWHPLQVKKVYSTSTAQSIVVAY